MSQLPDWVKLAQEQWNWRGTTRPPFAVVPNASQISVWDFPRPPKYVEDCREVVICFKGQEIARTKNAILVLETSHPPSFYIPPKDINFKFLKPSIFKQIPLAFQILCNWINALIFIYYN